MSSTSVTPGAPPSRSPTRFDRRLSKILDHATSVFYEKGYEGASMRDLSRVAGLSLAGLYYYFESKEELLCLIQKHYFTVVIERLHERLKNVSDSEARVRAGDLGAEVTALKRKYYRSCSALVDALKEQKGLEFNTRVATLSLFGMMNWIYTWYKPQIDPEAAALARQVGDIFLAGITSSVKR